MSRVALPLCLSLLALCAAHATETLVIDDFEYATVEEAQAHWVTPELKGQLSLIDRDGGKALRVEVDFTGDARRIAIDRVGDLDLSRWGRFSLDVYVDDPRMFGSLTFYMQSGSGWYRATGTLNRKGWQTLRFARADFGVEDTPGGWDSVRTIRFSPWKAAPAKGWIALDNLCAYREDWAVVIGSYALRTSESQAVQGIAETMSKLLADAGIMTSTIGDEDVEAGALRDYQVAIFAYNPSMSEGEIAQVREFVARGGKIMCFYSLPQGMAQILGLKNVGYVRQERPGQFALIKFDAPLLEGLPAQVRQNTWNLTNVEPASDDTKIIAWWYDDAGEATGYPAFAMSPAGIFMTHVLTADDWHTKKRMLLAMLGHYFPQVWESAAAGMLQPPDHLGHFTDVSAGRAWIQEQAQGAPRGAEALAALTASDTKLREATAARDAGRYPQAIDTAAEAWNLLGRAYLLALSPREFEFRACWEHSGQGPLANWDASIRLLAENGFNAIVPNQLWAGVALYESNLLPRASVVEQVGDQVRLAVEAGHKYGVEVHPWKVNWNLGHLTPSWFKDQMRAEGRLQRDYNGNEGNWLCPSDPRNQRLEVETMVEVARKYDVDGVHFDYIRYPGGEWCFCDGCRQRFQAATGVQIQNWPADTRREDIRPKWIQWRCDNISQVVRQTAEQIRAIKPHCKISAAVFSAYPACRESVGQDWVHWCREGWLDFVCPMNYTNSDTSFASTIANQMSYLQGVVPIYSGIGATSSSSTLAVDRVAGQIQIARALGADGFIIFNYGRSVADEIIPGIGLALTRGSTGHPHWAPAYRLDVGELTRDVAAGRHVAVGETVRVRVRRVADIPGRVFQDVMAQIVLQDALGRQLAVLQEDASLRALDTEVSFPARPGLQRVAVVGGYVDAAGVERPFVCRSQPIIGGEVGGVLADLF